MKIIYEKYSKLYYVELREGVSTQLTFEELEALGEQVHQLVQDEYSQQLQSELGGDYSCDGCTI